MIPEDLDDYADEDSEVTCWACGGTGLDIEGQDCENCDGYGYIDL